MYFYTIKLNKNEKNILLEMCCNACFGIGNSAGIYGIRHAKF